MLNTFYQLLDYLNPSGPDHCIILEETTLAVSHVAVEFNVLFDLRDIAAESVSRYCQPRNSRGYLLSAAMYLGCISLVHHLVDNEGLGGNTGRGRRIRESLFNAAYQSYLDIAEFLFSRSTDADSDVKPRTEEKKIC